MRTLGRLTRLLRPHRAILGLAFVAAAAEAAADLLQPWPLKFVFDSVFEQRPLPPVLASHAQSLFGSSPHAVLYATLLAMFAIAVLGAGASLLQDVLMPRIAHWVLHDLRRQLYWHCQGLSMAFYHERRVGDLMGTLTADIQAVRELVESALVGLVMNTLTLAGMVTIILLIDWRFALVALSIAPALFVIVYTFTKQTKEASREARRREGQVSSIAQEVLSSLRVVQAFTREDYEQARFERENLSRVSAGIRARTLQAQLKPLVELLVAAGTVLVVWYGARQVMAGALLPGSLLVFLAYVARLYKPMRELSKQTDVLNRAVVGMERIFEILDTEPTISDSPGARPAPRLRGEIVFDHVTFGYRSSDPVLRDISLRIPPGQVVAVVGASGAGKTSLLSLVPRFSDPDEGRIFIDGQDIREFTVKSLRAQISLVLQETVLFYGTVRDNIAYGRPDATPEEIVAASVAANADEFIQDLPDGYDTLVGERGVTLSGGQRQRIAIARAMIRNASIILMDEPTTGLDADAEILTLDGIGRLIAGRTALIVAHRLTTVRHADVILVLEDGDIIEVGSHEELWRRGGRYAALCELQFRGQPAGVGPDVLQE